MIQTTHTCKKSNSANIVLNGKNVSVYDYKNMFSFPNTYHELGLIMEACFFVMGFSVYQKNIETKQYA